MKLLSKTELKDKKNENALLLRETELTLAKETKELSDFRTKKEAEKKQILDEFIRFAEKIAGEKALLERGFATSEERKGVALRSLSALSSEADTKLREVKAIEATFDAREANCKAREISLTSELSSIKSRDEMLNKKADSVSASAENLTKREEDFAKRQKENAVTLADKALILDRREKVLDSREEDIKNAALSNESIANALKKDRETFEKEKSDEWTRLERDRSRDVKEIVETSYKKREAELSRGEKELEKDREDVRSLQLDIVAGNSELEEGRKALESDKKSFAEEKSKVKDEQIAREAELNRKEEAISAHERAVTAMHDKNVSMMLDISKREHSLIEKTRLESEKLNKRENDLNGVAEILKKRVTEVETAQHRANLALSKREQALDDRESVVTKMEASAKATVAKTESDKLAWKESKAVEAAELARREKAVVKREESVETKLSEAVRINIANEEESKQLIERTKREENRLENEKKSIAEERRALDRAWLELRNKQSKYDKSTS